MPSATTVGRSDPPALLAVRVVEAAGDPAADGDPGALAVETDQVARLGIPGLDRDPVRLAALGGRGDGGQERGLGHGLGALARGELTHADVGGDLADEVDGVHKCFLQGWMGVVRGRVCPRLAEGKGRQHRGGWRVGVSGRHYGPGDPPVSCSQERAPLTSGGVTGWLKAPRVQVATWLSLTLTRYGVVPARTSTFSPSSLSWVSFRPFTVMTVLEGVPAGAGNSSASS